MVRRPALERCLVDQLCALCRILSTMEVNKSFLRLPKCSGKPRYFPTPPSLDISRMFFANVFLSAEVLEEKVIEDLVLFIF